MTISCNHVYLDKNALFTTSPPQTNVVQYQLLPFGQKSVEIDESGCLQHHTPFLSRGGYLGEMKYRWDSSRPQQIRQEIPIGHFEGKRKEEGMVPKLDTERTPFIF
ncbi:hypothetical protein CEXT_472631 [Caerostris extrusa]|uniref:Uncharacterized protein n=1 Tax=Caerostris extrusa TaxID=172846 RepID=A0AAV4T1Y2_CAEEX|nr:hypothetical protein CEXT_472631 [Caerostris extrusa]